MWLAQNKQATANCPAYRHCAGVVWSTSLIILGAATARAAEPAASADVQAVARQILDQSAPQPQRESLVRANFDHAPALISAMAADLKADTPEDEQYRRIPWLWRVANGASKQNKLELLKGLLEVSLPQAGQPLLDWQAVVIGGGVIDGVSLAKGWPHERVAEVLRDNPALRERWQRLLAQAAEMADNEKIRRPTRYDALRIIPLDAWERSSAQLKKYLTPGIPEQLQEGAISGLSDIDRPETAPMLVAGLANFSEKNRRIAVDALLRTDDRAQALLAAIEKQEVQPAALSAAQRKALREHKTDKLREQAQKLLAE